MHQIELTTDELNLSQAIQEHVESYRDAVRRATEKHKAAFHDQIKQLAKDYGNTFTQTRVTQIVSENKLEIDDHHLKVLHGIFNPSFVTEILFNLNVRPSVVIGVNDLVPYRCNFPAELTCRSKSEKNVIAPCLKRLGKDDIFFCTLGSHRAYAQKLNLPVTRQDAERLGMALPPRDSVERPRHVRTTRRRQKQKDGSVDMDPTQDAGGSSTQKFAERWEMKRIPVTDAQIEQYLHLPNTNSTSGTYPGTSPGTSSEAVFDSGCVTQQHGIHHELAEIPRFQCSFLCPFTGEGCQNTAVHADVLAGNASFCEMHVTVTNDLYAKFNSNEMTVVGLAADTIKMDLDRIRYLDEELFSTTAAHSRKELLQERYLLAQRYGFGTPTEWISELADTISAENLPADDLPADDSPVDRGGSSVGS